MALFQKLGQIATKEFYRASQSYRITSLLQHGRSLLVELGSHRFACIRFNLLRFRITCFTDSVRAVRKRPEGALRQIQECVRRIRFITSVMIVYEGEQLEYRVSALNIVQVAEVGKLSSYLLLHRLASCAW